MSATILIVDDEDDIRKLIAGLLADEGYKTIQASNKLDTLALFEKQPPDAVLLDIWLEGGTREGLEILHALKQEQQVACPIIMMSGHGTLETAVEAIKTGAYDFLEKPFKTDRLLIMLRRALEQANLKQRLEVFEKDTTQEPIIAHSKSMQECLAEIEKLAPTKSRVMIHGEAGSGKSVIARLVHVKSGRTGPCITLNGGNFSVEKAMEADKGTLILEQPEDLNTAAQGALIRFLQETNDIRIITTTQADFTARIKSGAFREDLYYRLNVVPLVVPPLRERKNDIPDLVTHILGKLSHSIGRPAPHLRPEDMNWLQAQDWMGNVRELKNTLERLIILNRPLNVAVADGGEGEAKGGWANLLTLPLKDAREQFEHDYLQAQLLRHDRNITATADFVGMDRAALHRKLKGLGLTGSEK